MIAKVRIDVSDKACSLVDRIVSTARVLVDDRDIGSLCWMADNLVNAGWSDGDILVMLMCREEVNPTLDEDVANKIMRILDEKNYKKFNAPVV